MPSRISRHPIALLLALVSSLASNAAQSPMLNSSDSLLVLNQGDATLSIVDPTTHMQVAVIDEGIPGMVGHEVAVSPNGRFAYVPLYSDVGVGKPGTDGRYLLVVDLVTHKVVRRLDFGRGVRPHCVIYEPASDRLYVTTELDKSVTVIDPHTLKIVGSIPTHQEQSHMLAISHDGRRGYTANVAAGTVSVLDIPQREFITAIPIAATTQRISISNDDHMIFTSDQTQPRMAVIDAASNSIRNWVELPGIGYGSVSTPDGKTLLITLPGLGSLAAVDLRSMSVTHVLKVGERPQEVIVRPDGAVAYVSCFGGHQVAVVDIATMKVISMIDVGNKADGMAWATRRP